MGLQLSEQTGLFIVYNVTPVLGLSRTPALVLNPEEIQVLLHEAGVINRGEYTPRSFVNPFPNPKEKISLNVRKLGRSQRSVKVYTETCPGSLKWSSEGKRTFCEVGGKRKENAECAASHFHGG